MIGRRRIFDERFGKDNSESEGPDSVFRQTCDFDYFALPQAIGRSGFLSVVIEEKVQVDADRLSFQLRRDLRSLQLCFSRISIRGRNAPAGRDADSSRAVFRYTDFVWQLPGDANLYCVSDGIYCLLVWQCLLRKTAYAKQCGYTNPEGDLNHFSRTHAPLSRRPPLGNLTTRRRN